MSRFHSSLASVLIFVLEGTCSATDFQKDVLPILKEHCWKCHSNENEVKGNLAFDSLEDMTKVHIGEHSIIRPGFPEKSDLLERLKLDSGEEDFMPKKGDALRSRDLSTIEKWIQEGALIDEKNPTPVELARIEDAKLTSARNGGEVYFQWTNLTGRAIEAKFAGLDGESVKILLKNGKGFVVPLSSLNEESVTLAKKLGGK
ncbi:MAG: hypothetical protein KA250_12260 [Verrucomicrobiales bacterium]|nr:hypothetical protein [Verrucomicrobiales bacterium]